MSYTTEHIAKTLRKAREIKGLSQRGLSAMSGVPQGHISKIENGAVDLRLSSLIELARTLDLELTLVPRNTVPAVNSIVRAGARASLSDANIDRKARNELARLRDSIDHRPRNLLPMNELDQIGRYLREIQHFKLSRSELQAIRNVYEAVNAFLASPENRRAIEQSLKELQELRNYLVHRSAPATAGPAYTLDEDDNA